jgi:type IX secretion system PorP/SprF family membrane protein
MKKIIPVVLYLFLSAGIRAQDPQFSQFYAAPLYLGPSMAGTAGTGRLSLNFRDQWPKLSGKFVTYALSYDTYVHQYNSGIGVLFMRDDAGSGKLTTTQAGLNYSYRIKVNNDFFLQPGLQLQYYERKVNFSKLTFADQFYGEQVLPSTIESPPEEQRGHMDFSASVLAFAKKVWIGGSIDHLMKVNQTLEQDLRYVPLKLSVYGGIKLTLKQQLLVRDEQSMSFAFNFRNQASMQQLDVGMYYTRMPIMVGIWYRGLPIITSTQSKDALTVTAGFLVKSLTFTYSYDLTVSSLITSTGGAHELALVYLFDPPRSKYKRKMGAVPCPRF